MKISVKDSTNSWMTPSILSNNSKNKPDNLSPLTPNLIMSFFKPKKTTLPLLKKWRPGNRPLPKPIKSLNSSTNKIKNSKSKPPKSKNNVTGPKINTKNSAPISKPLSLKIKNSHWNSRAWKILWEWLKANLTSQSSREKTWERTTWSWLTKTKCWMLKSTNVWWVFWSTKRSTRICNKKLRTTLLAMRRQERCWTGKRPWGACWIR